MGTKYYCIVAILLMQAVVAFAQPSLPVDSLRSEPISADTVTNPPSNTATPFILGEIYVEGNKHTKSYIIKRELPFKTGDSIYLPQLIDGFEVARQQLINSKLFNDVVVALKSFRGYTVDIIIKVKERWYIFPLPYLKPVDRNLSEWAKQGYGLDRVNYGFKFTHYNFTGRNDKLRLWLIGGYTQQLQFQYEQPYADKALKHGYRVGFTYSFNKEVNYATANNQQLFVDSFEEGLKQWSAHVDYTYRPGLRTFNDVRLTLVKLRADSQIVQLNPKYFDVPGRKTIIYPELSYTLSYFKVDYIPFPLKGWMGEVGILKRGISSEMNMWEVNGKMTRAWPLSKKDFFAWQGNAILRLPFDQPFINQRLFGYNDMYLRGLENYVIDGVAGLLSRQSYRRELFRFSVPTFINSKSHDRIPFRIYARTFTDLGFSYNKFNTGNSLSNKLLATAGLGVDVVTFYDFILRFDYSFNQLGQNGLFLHIKNDF